MKKYFLLIAAVLTIASCKKEQKTEPNIQNVFGKWELARIYGMVPKPFTATPGNGDRYDLNNDSTYVRYKDNAIQAEGKYSIQITEVRDSIKFGVIKFTNPNAQDAFQIRSRTILFGSSAADGPVYEYRKID